MSWYLLHVHLRNRQGRSTAPQLAFGDAELHFRHVNAPGLSVSEPPTIQACLKRGHKTKNVSNWQ